MHEKTLLIGALAATAMAAGFGVYKGHERPPSLEIAPVTKLDSARVVRSAEVPVRLTASDGAGLQLVSIKGSAAIEDPLALTELHLVFENPEDRIVEGTFTIALPQRASVSRFAMKVGDVWQEGEVVERQAARVAYEDFLHRKQDPALMEQSAGNEFSARVFPIPARGTKEIVIAYAETLDGGSAYVLPLKGLPALASIDIDVHANGGSAQNRVFGLHQRSFMPAEDFIVGAIPRSAGLRNGELVMARVVPFASSRPDPVDSAVVLVDTSASRGLGMEEEARIVQRVLARLRPDARVTVAAFDQEVVPIYEGTAGGFGEHAVKSITERGALGASDFQQALAWAGGEAKKKNLRRVILVGDGVATAGETDGQRIKLEVEKLRAARIERLDAIAIGGIRDDTFLRSLVHGVLDKDGVVLDAEMGVDGLTRRLGEATTSGVAVKVDGATWSWPQTLDGVQAGDELIVYAEVPVGTPVRITALGQPFTPDLRTTSRPLLERAWAQAKIQSLIESPTANAESTRREIIALGTRHRILGAHTAMLVLETDADYGRFGIDRRATRDVLSVEDGRITVLHGSRGPIDDSKRTVDRAETTTALPSASAPAAAGGKKGAKETEGPAISGAGGGETRRPAAIDFDDGDTQQTVPADETAKLEQKPAEADLRQQGQANREQNANLEKNAQPAKPLLPEAKVETIKTAPTATLAAPAPTPTPRPRPQVAPAPKPPSVPNHPTSKSEPAPPPPPPPATVSPPRDKAGRFDLDDDVWGPNTSAPKPKKPAPSNQDSDRIVPPSVDAPTSNTRVETQHTEPPGEVRHRDVVVDRGLSGAEAATVLRGALPRLRACYTLGLRESASMEGELRLRVLIESSGVVQDVAEVDGTQALSSAVRGCSIAVVRGLRFPAPASADGFVVQGGVPASLTTTFVFVPNVTANGTRAPVAAAPSDVEAAPHDTPYDGRFKRVMDFIASGAKDAALDEARKWHAEDPGDVMALVALGEALEATGDIRTAARAYGSILELHPSRADSRRFAGERLERLADPAALRLAVDSFAKAVAQRPDHPSSHRLYAFALLRQHEHEKAFAALHAGTSRVYPPGRFLGAERILREDLGLIAAAWTHAEPHRATEIHQRLRAAGGQEENEPSLRFVLVWETDANDVDFHIHDARGGHAYYSAKELASGGTLYSDVTTGYGPECFTVRRPQAQRAYPYRVQANYYSRGPMGYGMGKLELVEHDGKGNLTFDERPFVVMKDRSFVDLGTVAPQASNHRSAHL